MLPLKTIMCELRRNLRPCRPLALLLLTYWLCLIVSLARLDILDIDEPSNINRVSLIPSNFVRFKRASDNSSDATTTTTAAPTPISTSTSAPTRAASNQSAPVSTITTTASPYKELILTTTALPLASTTVVPLSTNGPTRTTTKPISIGAISSKPGQKTTTKVPDSNASSLISTSTVHFDARDVTYFLESHPAHSIHDPRSYFTEERSSRSLGILCDEINKLPTRMRFAFMVRVFNELGRKIATKLNYYASEVIAILRKTPDDLGNKPEVSMLVDVINNAFESKEDNDLKENSSQQAVSSISELVKNDKEKEAVFNSSLSATAERFGHILLNFFELSRKSLKLTKIMRETACELLDEALKMGAKTLIQEVSSNDKFQITDEVTSYMDRILKMAIDYVKRHVKNGDTISSLREPVLSFKDLNPISDKTGLIGTWNNYLFSNLGTSERVVKLFASLLSRVPPEAKTRWINMHISQFNLELERTLSGFVVMQGMPHKSNSSELYLLDTSRLVQIIPNKLPEPRPNYSADKNRIPARCYLAGRRWRMILSRGLKGYAEKDIVIKALADKIGQLKLKMVTQSGNEIYRLCMPRVETGVRGWGINGDPRADDGKEGKFPFRNPIDNLNTMVDPFKSGAKLGYKIGVKVGYNEERNGTLELEKVGSVKNTVEERIRAEVEQVALTSYRRAATVAAKKTLEIAVHEGYLAALKVSVRAGMKIPAEAGSQVAALKCVSFGGQTGLEVGRTVAYNFMAGKEVSEKERKNMVKVGETHGLLAGEIMGESIGLLIGKEAAEESYRRSIIRGGKRARAKFHLDEFEAGAKLGFDYGVKEGKRIASSATLDPSAPRFFRFPKPFFTDKDKADYEVDHWEKDLIPPLSQQAIEDLSFARNHTTVSGSLRGTYMAAKETKMGLNRVSYSNLTYTLEVFANGFIMKDVAYLTLNGTVNNMGILRGSLVARDIFNDKDF